MTRWALPFILWSGFANPTSRNRISQSYYPIKSQRPCYSSTTQAPYRLKSRVSIYDKTGPYRTRSTYIRKPSFYYQSTSGGYGTYDSYDSYGVPFRSSYKSTDRSSYKRSAPSLTPMPSYDDYNRSHRRSSANYSSKYDTDKKSSSHPKKTVHWDESTFRGYHDKKNDGERHRHHRQHSGGNYDYGYDRCDWASASSNVYYYTEAISGRNRDYYGDETSRRSRKSRDYRDEYPHDYYY
ncbi:hypothetical protein SEUCBS139899_006012 [Sporothrix eucalyptigena]